MMWGLKLINGFFRTFSIFAISFMLICGNAFAGEEKKAGEVLEVDSYVFTIEEAEALKDRVKELEEKEALLQQYLLLEKNLTMQNSQLEKKIDIYETQLDLYKNMHINNKEYIDSLTKVRRFDNLEKIGMFVSGALIVSLSFRLATQ